MGVRFPISLIACCAILVVSPDITSGYHVDAFRLDPGQEILTLVIGRGLVLWGDHIISRSSGPDPGLADPAEIPHFDRFAIELYSPRMGDYSDGTRLATFVLPAVTTLYTVVGLESGRVNSLFTNIVLYAETMSLTEGLTKIAKGGFHRSRPFVYNDSVPMETRASKRASRSMWSGHTVSAFTNAVFAACTFQRQNPGSRYIKPVWLVGISCAASTAVYRVRAGQHFPSDVVVGAAVGSVIGWLIPWMHQNGNRRLSWWIRGKSETGIGVNWNF